MSARTPRLSAVPTAEERVLTPASAEDQALLSARIADVIAKGATIVLPYGMAPADPIETPVSEPIDLGDDDPKWRGYKVVVDLDMEIEAQALAAKLADTNQKDADRLEATYKFLELTIVAWNFTERIADPSASRGYRIEMLPQPREGGVRRLRASQLSPIVQAVGRAVRPDPN